ncbi:hypothetical protein EGW08_006161 [Elysia chlorotica]|uniref:Uncharacterized protein n=1 Tax=Elysia chlorotica TaxID=188477 RepID=A0A3S1HTX3_ELYCH|nr:hypothetical protein EGW08_006161 [Elysia chlorotica]
MGGGGVKKGILDFSYISSGAERNRNERIETRIRKVRSDRMGEWWFQRKSRLGHAPYAGYPQSESSEERIHIYRGNLTKAGCSHTKHSTPKKNTGIYSSVSRHTFGEALGSLRHANIANPSHAVPPDARVSSIDIPYHDTLSQDMPAGKNDIHFSRTEVYPPRENRRQVPSTPNSPVTFSPGHSNNIYSQLIALSGGINPSRAGSSIDKHHEGDGKVYLSCRFGAKSNDSFAKRDKFKTKKIEGNTKRQKTRRRGNNIKGRSPHKNNTQYLRVGEAVYRIVPNATHGNSSNSSSSDNSLGSAASATYSKPGMAHAYRMSDLDLSYDNFRDDHLRQLARHGRGVASSSTLDACTPPLCIRAGMAGMAGVTGVDSEHSSSSMGRDRIRF